MRITSVARIAGPSEDGQFFMVTRYDGLLGRLLGRKLFAVVRLEVGIGAYWGATNDATNQDVLDAVVRFERQESQRLERALLRGDAHWRPVEATRKSPALQLEAASRWRARS